MNKATGTKLVRESEIEAYLDRQVRRAGGITRKYTSPGRTGVPDRIVIFRSMVEFVECKAPGGKLSALQVKEIETLRRHGAAVAVLSTRDEVDDYVDTLVIG